MLDAITYALGINAGATGDLVDTLTELAVVLSLKRAGGWPGAARAAFNRVHDQVDGRHCDARPAAVCAPQRSAGPRRAWRFGGG